MNRIPTLDGWRGVAILMVLADHIGQNSRFKDQMWAHLGSFGVDIFFVLSGYLITARLLDERRKSLTIGLHQFYLRRAFRILPLVVAYLLTLGLLSLFVNLVDFRPAEIAGSLFFLRNYQFAADPQGMYTAHFWSLSIEEHFYLVWPALVLWLGNRRALWLALAGAAGCATWRLYGFTHPHSASARWFPAGFTNVAIIRTDIRIDGLLLGCALAILLIRPSIRAFIFHNFPKETPLVAAFLIFLNLERTNAMPTLTTYLLLAVMLGSMLVVQEGLAYQWLNARILVWIGTISYSMYVWQQLFLLHPDNSTPLGTLGVFPYNLACTFAAASCSFYFLERPAIAFGRQFVRRMEGEVEMEEQLARQ